MITAKEKLPSLFRSDVDDHENLFSILSNDFYKRWEVSSEIQKIKYSLDFKWFTPTEFYFIFINILLTN